MNPVNDMKKFLEEISRSFIQCRQLVVDISEESKKGNLKLDEMADVGYLSRECVSKLEDMRKDIEAMKAVVDKVTCLRIQMKRIQEQDPDIKVKTEICTASPKISKTCSLPKKGSEEFYQMMEFFGVSRDSADKGILKVSWQSMAKFITELTEDGKKIPSFIPKVYDDHGIIHRSR